jgi:hypothetical protein
MKQQKKLATSSDENRPVGTSLFKILFIFLITNLPFIAFSGGSGGKRKQGKTEISIKSLICDGKRWNGEGIKSLIRNGKRWRRREGLIFNS